jgi:hypothetical protein
LAQKFKLLLYVLARGDRSKEYKQKIMPFDLRRELAAPEARPIDNWENFAPVNNI